RAQIHPRWPVAGRRNRPISSRVARPDGRRPGCLRSRSRRAGRLHRTHLSAFSTGRRSRSRGDGGGAGNRPANSRAARPLGLGSGNAAESAAGNPAESAPRSFDAVLLDLQLPDSRGLDTFRSVQKSAPALPVVVLSGFEDETTALTAVQEGAQDYLVKTGVT